MARRSQWQAGVGADEKTVRSYIQKQEEEDKRLDELYNMSRPHQRSITERTALFSGLLAAAASGTVGFSRLRIGCGNNP